MKKITRNIIIGAVAVFVVAPLASKLGQGAPERQNAREASGPLALASGASPTPNVQAIVSRQSSDGITDAQITMDVVAKLEEWSLSRMRVHLQTKLTSMGSSADPQDMTAESVLAEISGKKLVVTRFRIGAFAPVAQVFGIVGDEAVRVACITNEAADVPITTGVCKDKIQEALGVSMELFGA